TWIRVGEERYGGLPSERQIVIKINGERVNIPDIYEHLSPQRYVDVAFIADFDTLLSENYACRKYLHKICGRLVEAFEFAGNPSKDRAQFLGTDCKGYEGWKHHPRWPLNEMWKCAEKRGRKDDERNLAKQVSDIVRQMAVSSTKPFITRVPCVVVLRWQPEPLELHSEDDLYSALKYAQDAGIPVFFAVMGREQMLANDTGKNLEDLEVSPPYLLYVPRECPNGEIALGDDVEGELARFAEDVERLRSIYSLEYMTDKVFVEGSHSIDVGLTKPGLDEEDKFTFDRRSIYFKPSSHKASLWGATLAVIILVGFSMSFPLYGIAVVAGKFVRYFGREGAD
ncbi:MAG: hypothetical protein H8D43_01395, partial [Chloroflexi bacterium]|nr:hypothetical protein [Chloroflexota bacterium]